MKAFSLTISTLVFMISGYFFVANFNLSSGINHLIYMSLLFILMLICVVGVLINVPLIVAERRRMKTIVYNRLAHKTMKRKSMAWN